MRNAWIACHAVSETGCQFSEEFHRPKFCDSGLSHVFSHLPNVQPAEGCYNWF